MPRPGDPIDLTKEQREALGHATQELVIELEAENSDLISDKPIHRAWYNAEPDNPYRTTPWPGASNLVVPYIRTVADALIARAVLTIFATNRFWSGTSEKQFFRDRIDSWFDFLNYTANHGFDTFSPIHDTVTEQYIHGHAVFQQVWEDNQRYVVPPNASKPVKVSLGRGPKLVFWPSEYILYNRECPISDAEAIVCQNNMTWGKLSRQAQLCGWDEDSVAFVQDQQGLEGSAAMVREQRRRYMGLEGQSDMRLEPHDIREVLLDWPLFQSLDRRFKDIASVNIGEHEQTAITTPIIVYLHRKTGTILDARHYPYLLPEWNFYETRYRNTDSRGLSKILEHIQRGQTTMFNQAIDAVTWANGIKAVTRDKSLASRPFVPNQWMVSDDIEGIKELSGQKNVMPEIQILQTLLAVGERVSGQADPAFGRETRMGGHPQPATNFLGLQANSQVLNTLPMKSIRKALSKAGEHRTIMLQQFEKNEGGWIGDNFDEDDAQQIMEVLDSDRPVSGQIRFDVQALSELHNPESAMSRAISTYQLFTQFAADRARFGEVFLKLQPTPEAMQAAAADLAKDISAATEGMTKMVLKVLENAGVEDAEDFVKGMVDAGQTGQELIAGAGQRLQQLAAGQTGAPQGPVSGPQLGLVPGGGAQAAAGLSGARGSDRLY